MKPGNPVLAAVIAASIFLVCQSPAMAEKWSAIGILTTQVKGEEAHARYVEIDDFETHDLCKQVVNRESHSDDYIGQGGTNGKVPSVQWNYDANCVQKRH